MKKANEKSGLENNSENSIQIFPTNDYRLKFLGEIFSNESSRKILTLLLDSELTVMEISKKSGFSANLIIHHLKKMMESEIVTITKELKTSRGRPLKFYRAKSAFVIVSKGVAKRATKSKSLRKTLEKITRFSVIGIIGSLTWIVSNSQHVLETASKYPRPTLPPYMTPIEPQHGAEFFSSLVVTTLVIVACLGINHYIPKLFRK